MDFKILNSSNTFSSIEYRKLILTLKSYTNLFMAAMEDWDLSNDIKVLYLIKGDAFLIECSTKAHFTFNESVHIENESGQLTYYANESGYLLLENGILKIQYPCIPDKYLLKLYLIYLPVINNTDSLKTVISRNSNENIDFSKPTKILLKEGKAPKEPIDAHIEWKVDTVEHPPMLENGKIDYRSYSRFKEIKKGTILAEKILMAQGLPGANIYGDIIEVQNAEDVVFYIGENIEIDRSQNGKEVYIAGATGLLEASYDSLSISKVLRIDSDIGFETGNVEFSGDIEINGNVKSMFSVTCGGNLKIMGSVENGATIQCRGSAEILKGIIGNETKVNILKDLHVEYIQDCKIRIGGDIVVINSIYNSYVFSKGYLTVKGQNFTSNSHGSIVGGAVSSMKGMDLHSVGSIASETRLVCGIDLDLKKVLTQLEETIPLLNSKIIKIQNNLGVDIVHNSLDVLTLTKARKEQLKKKLKELKGYIVERDKIKSRIEKIQKEVYSKDLEALRIEINNFVLEDTIITIGDYSKTIKEKESIVIFSLCEDEIVKIY